MSEASLRVAAILLIAVPTGRTVVRTGFAVAPILVPLGFFLSILRPDSEKPHGVLWLTVLAGLALGVATVTLGIGLLLA